MYFIKKYYDGLIYEKVNKPSKDALKEYLNFLKISKGLISDTIYQYSWDIKDFLCWNYENLNDKYILNIKEDDLNLFFEEVSKTCGVNRRNRLLSSIKMFMEYFVQCDKYSLIKNPAARFKTLKGKRAKEQYYLNDKDITYLINHFVNINDLQLALWVSIMYDTAMKRDICLNIKKTDIKNMNNNIININGSNNKHYEYFLSNRTINIAIKYLKYRMNDCISSLFISGSLNKKHRASVKTHTLHDWSKVCCKVLNQKYNTEYDFNTKDFRNSSLKNFYNGTHYILRERMINKLSLDEVHYISHNKRLDSTMESIKFYEQINIYNIFNIK